VAIIGATPFIVNYNVPLITTDIVRGKEEFFILKTYIHDHLDFGISKVIYLLSLVFQQKELQRQ
jgi:hypothetical protein